MTTKKCNCGHEKDDHLSGGNSYCRLCAKGSCRRFRTTKTCPGSGREAARTQGGAHWTNVSKCPSCGKKVPIIRRGVLGSHPAKSK